MLVSPRSQKLGHDSRMPVARREMQRRLSVLSSENGFCCRTTSASTAPYTSRRMCCPTHCASHRAPCQSCHHAHAPLRYKETHSDALAKQMLADTLRVRSLEHSMSDCHNFTRIGHMVGGGHFCVRVARLATSQGLLHLSGGCLPTPPPPWKACDLEPLVATYLRHVSESAIRGSQPRGRESLLITRPA